MDNSPVEAVNPTARTSQIGEEPVQGINYPLQPREQVAEMLLKSPVAL